MVLFGAGSILVTKRELEVDGPLPEVAVGSHLDGLVWELGNRCLVQGELERRFFGEGRDRQEDILGFP